jgi:3'-phosphoadenosine 5'-phosphosulfate sulfotransferase (PAPS reductase)/FAD synthetase
MPSYEDLKALQSESLERKILITQTRIIEWYLRYNGQVYVSFSGGKDSTVLLHIARQCFPDIEAVFADTGLEYTEIRNFVKTFDNVTTVRPKMKFNEVIDKFGYPVISKEVANVIEGARKGQKVRLQRINGTLLNKDGGKSQFNVLKYKYLLDAPFKISDKCCNEMKKKPMHEFNKRTGKKPIIGMMADESNKREQDWLKTGCNAFDLKLPQSQPMAFWTEQDVLHYIKKYNLPYCSVYGEIVNKSEFIGQLSIDEIKTDLMTTGCKRTGCVFCMFGVHLEQEPNRFQQLKEMDLSKYEYCIREENGLGLGKVLDFINVKYV